MHMNHQFLLLILPVTTFSYICHHESQPADTIQTGFSSSSSSSATLSPNMMISWHNMEPTELIAPSILSNISTYISSHILVPRATTSIHLSRNCPDSSNTGGGIQPNSQTDTHYCVEECSEVFVRLFVRLFVCVFVFSFVRLLVDWLVDWLVN